MLGLYISGHRLGLYTERRGCNFGSQRFANMRNYGDTYVLVVENFYVARFVKVTIALCQKYIICILLAM